MTDLIEIKGKIKEIIYSPTMCEELPEFQENYLDTALKTNSAMILRLQNGSMALSRWVSPKRTRSYPYARVYNTLGFIGKKVTVIPVMKDEGLDGDRDFIQFDTVSLMTLLGVYVIIAYYSDARRSSHIDHNSGIAYGNKITDQEFDADYVRNKVYEIANYQSDALHWNMKQLEDVGKIGEIALASYSKISQKLGVKMHDQSSARKKINTLLLGIESFRKASRLSAVQAQYRESMTEQPKELLNSGKKGTITITNLYNGFYAFTVDEIYIEGDNVYLIEAKHTSSGIIPSLDDIKDALIKMLVFGNLKTVTIADKEFKAIAAIKLTSRNSMRYNDLQQREKSLIDKVISEARKNNFYVIFNEEFL